MANEIISDSLDIPCWRLSKDDIASLTAANRVSNETIITLTAKADSLLNTSPESVTDKTPLPPSGDKHDYLSLAIYVWPNPEKPDGLPYIHKDGLVNPEIHEYDLPRLWLMATGAETLALAALYTGHTAYAEKAAQLIRVWFLDPDTAMNPHLNFGQFVPGDCDGRCYGIIETTTLIRIVNAVQILECLPGFTYPDGAAIRRWFRQYADWLQTSELGIEEAATTNNHRAWHMAQLASYFLFSDQLAAARTLLEKVYPDIIEQQMASDGSMPRELARTRSYHYCVFVLIPLLMCAEMGKSLNLDLVTFTTADGRGIARGLDWFMPYLTGEKTWTWQMIIEENPCEEQYPLLRIAANVLGESRYEAALNKLSGHDYDRLLQNLVIPPACS